MRVIFKEPGKRSRIMQIPNELKVMQKLVDGPIETVSFYLGTVMIVNEEGKLRNLLPNVPNPAYNGDVIVGNLIVAKVEGEEFGALSVERAKMIAQFLDEEGAF